MKTKTMKLTAVLMLILSMFVMPIWAQTEGEIISNANNTITNLFNKALEEKKEEIKKDNIENNNIITENKKIFNNKNDSVKNTLENLVQQRKKDYREEQERVKKEEAIANDNRNFVNSNDLLNQQITELDKRIVTLETEQNDLIAYIRADIPRMLDSTISNKTLVNDAKANLLIRIDEIKNLKGKPLMVENYPYYEKFSQFFGKEDKATLEYKLKEKLKRKKEVALLLRQNKLLFDIKSQFLSEMQKYQKAKDEEIKKIETSDEDVAISNETKTNAEKCRKEIIDFGKKLAGEMDESGELTKLESNSTSSSRSKVHRIFVNNRLESPDMSQYATNLEIITNVLDYLTTLIDPKK